MSKGHKTRPVTLRGWRRASVITTRAHKNTDRLAQSRIPDSVGLEWAREFTFLASSQGLLLLLLLLVPEPHCEKQHPPLD